MRRDHKGGSSLRDGGGRRLYADADADADFDSVFAATATTAIAVATARTPLATTACCRRRH